MSLSSCGFCEDFPILSISPQSHWLWSFSSLLNPTSKRLSTESWPSSLPAPSSPLDYLSHSWSFTHHLHANGSQRYILNLTTPLLFDLHGPSFCIYVFSSWVLIMYKVWTLGLGNRVVSWTKSLISWSLPSSEETGHKDNKQVKYLCVRGNNC